MCNGEVGGHGRVLRFGWWGAALAAPRGSRAQDVVGSLILVTDGVAIPHRAAQFREHRLTLEFRAQALAVGELDEGEPAHIGGSKNICDFAGDEVPIDVLNNA